MVSQIYPTELQFDMTNSFNTEVMDLSITNDIVSSKINDERDDFNFEIVNFPFLDGAYILQLILFILGVYVLMLMT